MTIEDNVITETWEQVIKKLEDTVPKEVHVDWAYTGGGCCGVELYPKHSKDCFPMVFITMEDVPNVGEYDMPVNSFMFAVGYYPTYSSWEWDGTQSVSTIIVNEELDIRDTNPIRHNDNGYVQTDYCLPSDRTDDHNKWAVEKLIDVVNGYIRA